MQIQILYEDSSIIVIRKPAGLATETASVTQPDCVSLIKKHLCQSVNDNTKEPYVGIIHRLDQPVAGLLVFAKNKKAASSLSRQVSGNLMNKHYIAVVEGIVDVKEDTLLTDMIYKDAKTGKAFIADDPGSMEGSAKVQEAKLFYHTDRIIEDKNLTVLSIKLITGRFHQIRAQMSHMGHPIAGDVKYGSSVSYSPGIALAADRLEFFHPDSGEKVEKIVDFSFLL